MRNKKRHIKSLSPAQADKKILEKSVHKSFKVTRCDVNTNNQDDTKSYNFPLARFAPIALAALTYMNSLTCGFTYDDRRAILENRNVASSVSWQHLIGDDFWGSPMRNFGSHKSYRPLVTLTFKIQALIFGLQSAFVFHLFNLVLHLLVVDSIYQVTRFIHLKVIQQSKFKEPLVHHRANKSTIASLTALLFACHPIHVEAVTSLVGRAELMSTWFALLSFHYLGKRLIKTKGQAGKSEKNYELAKSALFTTLALMSKENCGASIIVINLLLLLWYSATKRRPLDINGALVTVGLLGAVLAFRIQLGSTVESARNSSVFLPKVSHLDNPLAQEAHQFCLRQPEILELGDIGPEELDKICSSVKMLNQIDRWMKLTRFYLPMFSLKLMIFPTELSYDWPLASIGLVKSPLEVRFVAALFVYLAVSVYAIHWAGSKLFTYDHLKLSSCWIWRSDAPPIDKRPQRELLTSSPTITEYSDESESETGSVGSLDTIRSEDSGFVDSSSGIEFQVGSIEQQQQKIQPRQEEKNDQVSKTYTSCNSKQVSSFAPSKLQLNDLVGWSLVWLIVPYLPASNQLVFVGFLVAERVLYLPSFGLCLLMAVVMDQLASDSLLIRSASRHLLAAAERTLTFGARRLLGLKSLLAGGHVGAQVGGEKRSVEQLPVSGKKATADTTAKLALVLPLLILFSIKSCQRNADWLDEPTLFASNLAQSPGKSLANLASLKAMEGGSSSFGLYEAALRLEPRSAELHYNLALLLQNQFEKGGKRALAKQIGNDEDPIEYHYKLALKLRKNFPLAALNLAAHQYGNQRQLEEAWNTLRQCVSLDQMNPSETNHFHRHVQVQIECLISGAKLRLPPLKAAVSRSTNLNAQIERPPFPSAAEAAPIGEQTEENEFADCQLALDWLAEAELRLKRLVEEEQPVSLNDALASDAKLGDPSKQMATIHWLRAQCYTQADGVANQLKLASQFALASQTPVQANLYTSHALGLARSAPEEARKLLERALEVEGRKRNVDTLQLAHIQAALARLPGVKPTEAFARTKAGLSLAPDEPSLLSLAARLAYELGEREQSERLHAKLVQVLESPSSSAKSHRQRGAQTISQARWIEQRKLATALANYGAILQVNGRIEAAKQQYRRALQVNPSNSVAAANLRRLASDAQ